MPMGMKVSRKLAAAARLARGGAGGDTRAMNEKEISQRVEEILRKKDRGERLTSQEETILAYTYYAAREQRMAFVVPREADAGE